MESINNVVVCKSQPQHRVCDAHGYRLRAEAICFRDHSRKEVLLVKCRKTEKWKFPGGGIEPNETGRDAAIRELSEEVNKQKFVLITINENGFIQGGIFGDVLRRIGLFKNDNNKSKTQIYSMVAGKVVEDWIEKEWRLTKWFSTTEVICLMKKDSKLIHLECVVDELKEIDDYDPVSSGSE